LVKFAIEGTDKVIEIFTTRLDTIYGATFMVLAPEHPLAMELVQGTAKRALRRILKKDLLEIRN